MQNEKYDPLSIEKKWQKNWEQGNKFQPVDSDDNFSIVIPVFNEAQNIKNLIEEIFLYLEDYKKISFLNIYRF